MFRANRGSGKSEFEREILNGRYGVMNRIPEPPAIILSSEKNINSIYPQVLKACMEILKKKGVRK